MSQDLQVAFGKQCRMQRRQTKLIASRAILFGDPWFLSGLSLGFLGAFSFSPQQGDIK